MLKEEHSMGGLGARVSQANNPEHYASEGMWTELREWIRYGFRSLRGKMAIDHRSLADLKLDTVDIPHHVLITNEEKGTLDSRD